MRGVKMSKLLEGKRGLILGVLNKYSIAWAIAQAASAQGAQLALTYLNERVEEGVRKLASNLTSPLILPCDVTRDTEIAAAMDTIEKEFGELDFLVHSVAYAPAADLEVPVAQVSRQGYLTAHEISAFSLVPLARGVAPLMKNGGNILAMTYLGAEKVVPGYNIMGVAKASLEACVRYLAYDLAVTDIRVNAISAGPINTAAARGVTGFTQMRQLHGERAPLGNVTAEQVAHAAVFLLSPMSGGVTGEVLHVDGGYHIMGM